MEAMHNSGFRHTGPQMRYDVSGVLTGLARCENITGMAGVWYITVWLYFPSPLFLYFLVLGTFFR